MGSRRRRQRIRRNSIFSNDGLGIDLSAAGVTPNDAGNGDNGGNHQQNFPVISRATPNAVSGTINSTAFGNYRFADVSVGETYILTVSSKKYFFAEPTRIVNVQDNLEDLDFVGEN